MKNKIRHKWKFEEHYSFCINCDLRRRTKKENILQPDGNLKPEYRIEYFTKHGEIIKNLGCKKEIHLQLF